MINYRETTALGTVGAFWVVKSWALSITFSIAFKRSFGKTGPRKFIKRLSWGELILGSIGGAGAKVGKTPTGVVKGFGTKGKL